jgi:N-acyl-phosphatidylethanolamine-hydrolysing phospholipase D
VKGLIRAGICLTFVLVLLGDGGAVLATRSAAATSHQQANGRFANPYAASTSAGIVAFLERRLLGDDEWPSYDAERDGTVPRMSPRLVALNERSDNARVTWIGQSTVLVQHAGVNVLTDPVFSNRASPVSFAGPARVSAPGLPIEALPPIDLVVISHDHFDHLDRWTIRRLGNTPLYLVPLGLRAWLEEAGIAGNRIVELDWWQAVHVRAGGGSAAGTGEVDVEVTATPSQHVSGRSLTDRNRRLWASWVVSWRDFSFFFAGDTGYNDRQFKAIGDRFGGFDLGIIPIGSYAPREYMQNFHLDPDDAVKVHQDIRALRSMAVHWGTFDLTAEHLLEPPVRLQSALEAAGLPTDAFSVYAVGESRSYLPRQDQGVAGSGGQLPHSILALDSGPVSASPAGRYTVQPLRPRSYATR